jgi:diacylglycerol O-acyltransferase
MRLLEPLDAAMMTAETLSNPLHAAAVLIMSPPADAGPAYVDDLYRKTLTAREQVDPRLRRFPYRAVSTTGLWVWRDTASLDLERHCRRITLPGGSGEYEFWQIIGELHAARLDPSRPMWNFYLIDGLENGRFGLYIKVHHTLIDGVAGMQMIADRLSADPRRRSMPPFYADGGGNDHHGDSRIRLPHNLFGQLIDLAGAAVSSLTPGAVHFLSPFGAPHTRFNGRLGHERAVVAGSWAKGRIRAVQETAGVSGNDVVTAVVGGVLRAWLSDHGELPRRTLVGICPITARGREHQADALGGNRFGIWLCPLGTNLDDPAAQLKLIHRSMAEGKRRVAAHGLGPSLLSAAPSIASTVLSPMVPFVPRLRTGYNMPISSVPGPRDEMYWNGPHLDEIYPISTVSDGQVLNATICSYANRVSFGYVVDRKVMPDIDVLLPLTERCLADLESAVKGVS